jgi:hypothetical protein
LIGRSERKKCSTSFGFAKLAHFIALPHIIADRSTSSKRVAVVFLLSTTRSAFPLLVCAYLLPGPILARYFPEQYIKIRRQKLKSWKVDCGSFRPV